MEEQKSRLKPFLLLREIYLWESFLCKNQFFSYGTDKLKLYLSDSKDNDFNLSSFSLKSEIIFHLASEFCLFFVLNQRYSALD
jgi:hypothetical protein